MHDYATAEDVDGTRECERSLHMLFDHHQGRSSVCEPHEGLVDAVDSAWGKAEARFVDDDQFRLRDIGTSER